MSADRKAFIKKRQACVHQPDYILVWKEKNHPLYAIKQILSATDTNLYSTQSYKEKK